MDFENEKNYEEKPATEQNTGSQALVFSETIADAHPVHVFTPDSTPPITQASVRPITVVATTKVVSGLRDLVPDFRAAPPVLSREATVRVTVTTMPVAISPASSRAMVSRNLISPISLISPIRSHTAIMVMSRATSPVRVDTVLITMVAATTVPMVDLTVQDVPTTVPLVILMVLSHTASVLVRLTMILMPSIP